MVRLLCGRASVPSGAALKPSAPAKAPVGKDGVKQCVAAEIPLRNKGLKRAVAAEMPVANKVPKPSVAAAPAKPDASKVRVCKKGLTRSVATAEPDPNPLARPPGGPAAISPWASILQVKLRQCSKLEVVSDCTGLNTIGELLFQLAPALTSELLSVSEIDPKIRKLLGDSGLKVYESMQSRNFHDLPAHRGPRVYVCGPPCQPFTPRNAQRMRWRDPRSECVKHSLHNLKASDADFGLIENSHHLRAQMPLVFPKPTMVKCT